MRNHDLNLMKNFIVNVNNKWYYKEEWTDECLFDLRERVEDAPFFPSWTKRYTRSEWVDEGCEIVLDIFGDLNEHLRKIESVKKVFKNSRLDGFTFDEIMSQIKPEDPEDTAYNYGTMWFELVDEYAETEEGRKFVYMLMSRFIEGVAEELPNTLKEI